MSDPGGNQIFNLFLKKTSLTLLVQKSVELTVGKIKKNDFAGLTDVLFVGVGTG